MSATLTPYHARYYALELRRRGTTEDVASVGTALFDARVDLNPHQVEAALFGLAALRERERDAPGRILADEVGLGKTIEAGLVLCQLWAERKRRLLVLAPAALRKQWVMELETKFGLPARIAEGRGEADRFGGRGVVVASYPYVARRLDALVAEEWDLVVCDEAHRLRNAWQAESKQARSLAKALGRFPKLLLTATPLQNSLIELFGLCSIVDDRVFGDVAGFKARFMKGSPDYAALRERLAPVMKRTLRKEVLPYIRYTERRALTWKFRAGPAERRLYDEVSEFLAREELASMPAAQRGLLTMVLRKLLASSSVAIAGALRTVQRRVERALAHQPSPPAQQEFADEGFDDAWLDEVLDPPSEPTKRIDLRAELGEITRLAALAESVGTDRRAAALVEALLAGFARMRERGAAEKAVIFTESRRTQAMIRHHLEANGFAGEVTCFHGGGPDADADAILAKWTAAHPTAATGGSRAANLRAAIVEHFRTHARVLIATEAGAEGLNLQFCSLVVNYDLPWNPQRVEQRIGRCHRYGQKHDVVVVNFAEETNAAEQRVLELLGEKFQLFDGVFGASDAVLGAIESGVGFERRIHKIFDTCRTPAAIEAGFAELRRELEDTIREREERARRALLDHFDADVHDRLKVQLDAAKARLSRMEGLFWQLTRWGLGDRARFDDAGLAFELVEPPDALAAGRYELVRRDREPGVADAYVYRLNHPLGEHVLARGATARTPNAHLVFDVTGHGVHVSAVEALRGKAGWLRLDRVRVTGFADEEHLVFSGAIEGGGSLDAEVAERLFLVKASLEAARGAPPAEVEAAARHGVHHVTNEAGKRNARDFDAARERLYRWAEDQVLAAEETVKELRRQERDLDRAARGAPTLQEKAEILKRLDGVVDKKVKARHHLNTVEDDVRARRAALLDELERRISQRSEVETVFAVSWQVV